VGQNFFKVKLTYTKGEDVKFLSHLDHIRALERALRRSDLALAYSEGFNPRLKMSFLTRALKVGETSESCQVVLTFIRQTRPEEVKAALNSTLPAGFKVLDAELYL